MTAFQSLCIDNNAEWVTDNYLGFARNIKWFYYPLILVEYSQSHCELKPCNVEQIHQCLGGMVFSISYVMSREISFAESPKTKVIEIKLVLSSIHRINNSSKYIVKKINNSTFINYLNEFYKVNVVASKIPPFKFPDTPKLSLGIQKVIKNS